MARYQVGQKIIVGFHEINNRPVQKFVGNMFFPWEETLRHLHLVELECLEHHKVAYEHQSMSPENQADSKPYDGFIFRDKKGRRWYNQYPTASYGQLSTDSDYYFALAEGEFDGYHDVLDTFEDVTTTVDRISRGIRDFKRISTGEMKLPGGTVPDTQLLRDRQAMLERHRTYVCKKVEQTFPVKIELKERKLMSGATRPDILICSLTYNAG